MNTDKDILSKINRKSGMTVPDGYFDDFAARMSKKLPMHEPSHGDSETKGSLWFKIRPYAYMAAMFAGIWCMLNLFNVIGSQSTDLSIDNNPVIARALSNETFVDDYYLYYMDESELLEDMYDMGLSPDEITDTTYEESTENGFNL